MAESTVYSVSPVEGIAVIEASLPEPSPKSMREKLKALERTRLPISSLSRLTNAPSLFSEARMALSLTSMVP